MRVIVQRSGNSKVLVNNKEVGNIDKGLVLLVGFKKGDTSDDVFRIAKKIINLRIFEDDGGKLNKNILDIEGSILSISQFTLYADLKKGNRPSFIEALDYQEAKQLYELFNEELKKYVKVETGIFGENMDTYINNIGPITIIVE